MTKYQVGLLNSKDYQRISRVRDYIDTVKYHVEIFIPTSNDSPISVFIFERKTQYLLYQAHLSETSIKEVIKHLILNYLEER